MADYFGVMSALLSATMSAHPLLIATDLSPSTPGIALVAQGSEYELAPPTIHGQTMSPTSVKRTSGMCEAELDPDGCTIVATSISTNRAVNPVPSHIDSKSLDSEKLPHGCYQWLKKRRSARDPK